MSEEAIFPNGLIFKLPRDNAPEFIKGSISIKTEELITFLRSQDGEWVNLDLKVSKNGKAYAQVNTWKPDNQQSSGNTRNTNSDFNTYKPPSEPAGDKFEDGIPF